MAPKGRGTKRAASPARARDASPARSPNRTNDAKRKCALVNAAVLGVTEAHLPESMRTTLSTVIPSSLGIPKDARHPFQAAAVEQLGEVLAGIRARLEANVVEWQAKVDNADADRLHRTHGEAEARDAVSRLEASVADAKAAAAQAGTDLKAAEKTSREAETAQRDGNAESALLEAEHGKIEAALKGASGTPLKERALHSSEKVGVLDMGKKLGADPSLLDVLPQVFRKLPADYGRFDIVALDHVEETLSKRVAVLAKGIAEAAPAKAALAAAVEAADKYLADSMEKKTASAEAAVEAKKALAEGGHALKLAESAVGRFLPDLKIRADSLDNAKHDLSHFVSGALAAFTELRDQETKPPAMEENIAKETEAEPIAVAPAATQGWTATVEGA